MIERTLKAVLAVVLLMVLAGFAAFLLASRDKHPKDPRYMVRLEAL